MANEIVTLPAALESPEGRDLVRSMLAFAADRLMEMEVRSRCGADYGERSSTRSNSRNGYRDRGWETRCGRVDLQVPKLRQGSYFPSFLEPRRTAEKALAAVIQEAYLQGVSTRAVDDLVKALGGTGVSRSEVSRLCEEVEERVLDFLERSLEGQFPYLWLDATYIKVREGGRIVSKATVMAIGLSEEGKREVLGMRLGHAETEAFWTEFLRSLLDRGLRGVSLVISDAHIGLRKAIERCLGCSWQRCRVHLMRNILTRVPQGKKDLVAATIRTAFAQTDREQARQQWKTVSENLRNGFPGVSQFMDNSEEEALAFMEHPSQLWSMIASNNGLERINRELKRRADVVQIFPNDNSVIRLMGAILMEQHDEWQVARRQVTMKSLTGASTKEDAFIARATNR